MTELTPWQRAGQTKRKNTLNALLDAADGAFADSDYQGIQVEHIVSHSAVSAPTFYNVFPGRSAWASAVLDQRLSEALDQAAAAGAEAPRTPHARLLGHLGLLERVSAPLPGITWALTEERRDQKRYGEMLPRYYGEVTQVFADGQGQRTFRSDIAPEEMAEFALDSLATAYAVHLDNPATRAMSASLVLDGLASAE
jgi:AcrR family transcriptional regulator